MCELITVVIPAYNAADRIIECLSSVWSQPGVTTEVIVIDDGSIDNLEGTVQTFCGDSLRYFRQNNAGPAAARNRGILEAKGKYIAFLDADDVWLPGKLAKQLAVLQENPEVALCFTDMMHFENGNKIHHSYLHEKKYFSLTSGWVYKKLLQQCFIFTPSVMVRSQVLNELGSFNESLKIGEDYELWLRIARTYQVAFIDEPLLIRHRHGGNITANTGLYIHSLIRMYEMELKYNAANRANQKIIFNSLAELYFNLGYFLFAEASFPEARKAFFRSFSYKPNIESFRLLICSCLPSSLKKFLRRVRTRFTKKAK